MLLPFGLRPHSSSTAELPNRYSHNPWYKKWGQVKSAIAEGYRARMIDADDLFEVLVAIADRLDPPVREPNHVEFPCPDCGERDADRLVVQEGDLIHCRSCGIVFDPAAR